MFWRKINVKFSGNSENSAQRAYQVHVKELSFKIRKFLATLILALFIGSVSLTNFSLAFFMTIVYVPLCLIVTQIDNNAILKKMLQTTVVFILCPFVYTVLLYMLYMYINDKDFKLLGSFEIIIDRFYSLYLLSKISNIWTFDLLTLGLFPIWLMYWFMATLN